jgi:hypothetical protein
MHVDTARVCFAGPLLSKGCCIIARLPTNGSTCYTAPFLRLFAPNSLQAYRHHSSTSHRLFLPICLMYYYSLQINNGIQNQGCDWPRIPSRGSVLPVTALPPLLPSQHRSTRTGSWQCAKFPFVSLFWFVGLYLWVAGAPTSPTLKQLFQQLSSVHKIPTLFLRTLMEDLPSPVGAAWPLRGMSTCFLDSTAPFGLLPYGTVTLRACVVVVFPNAPPSEFLLGNYPCPASSYHMY